MGRVRAGAFRQAAGCFLAFSGEPLRLRKWLSSLVPDRQSPLRLNRILDCVDLVVYASPETPVASLNVDKGVVLGGLFERQAHRSAAEASILAEALSNALGADRTSFEPPLGDYAAFLRVRGSISAVRGPSGAVAMHYFEAGPLTAFFSHAEIGRQLGPSPTDGATRYGSEAQPRICELEPGGMHRIRTAGR